jgi:ethanolamine permease
VGGTAGRRGRFARSCDAGHTPTGTSTLPVAGAGYGFARRAMGPLGGFATGTAILIEYVTAPAAIVVFIGGYVEALGLFGLTSGWPVYLAFCAILIGVHLYGVGEALKLMFVITGIAVVALVVFVAGMIPKFSVDNLFDIEPTTAAGASDFLPFGYAGVLAAILGGDPDAARRERRAPRRARPRCCAASSGGAASAARR